MQLVMVSVCKERNFRHHSGDRTMLRNFVTQFRLNFSQLVAVPRDRRHFIILPSTKRNDIKPGNITDYILNINLKTW